MSAEPLVRLFSQPSSEDGWIVNERLERLVPHVYRYALRLCRDEHLAEDLTQEAILRGWRRRDQFAGHPRDDDRRLRVWLLTVAANLWRDELRRGAVRAKSVPNVAQTDQSSAPAEKLERQQALSGALALLDELPPRQRDVLYLTACEGLSPAEIAEVLGVTPSAVMSSLSVARKAVRDRLAQRDASDAVRDEVNR